MNELITKKKMDEIVQKFSTGITTETTPEQLLEVISKIIYSSINSIDKSALSNLVAGQFLKKY